jgi:hypothetical protein
MIRLGSPLRGPPPRLRLSRFRRANRIRSSQGDERVAQLVEHTTFNREVLGSSPSALTTISKSYQWVSPQGCRDLVLPVANIDSAVAKLLFWVGSTKRARPVGLKTDPSFPARFRLFSCGSGG